MKTPNLLFILTDQQRADTMACYGNDAIQTPHLNALADQSYVFENSYVTQPVCSPARASILTGRYPHACGVTECNIPLSTDFPTIAELVDPNYRCGYFGKWHLGDEIFPQHGFDEWVGTEDSYRPFFSSPERHASRSDYHHFLIDQGLEPDRESFGQRIFSRPFEASLDEPLTKAAYLGMRAEKHLNDIGDHPFILFVSYLEPHPPHTGPFNDLYDPAALPTGPTFLQKPPSNASLLNRLQAAYYGASMEYGFDLRTEEGWRTVRARYWGNVTLVDRSVGRILKALDESGHADDTIVVFTSEHGEMAGDHGILGKCVMYEESLRVPLLIRIPGSPREQVRIPGNFSQIDLLPTLLDLMNQSIPPDGLQGESRASVLGRSSSRKPLPFREGREFDNDVFIEWNGANGHPRAGEAEVNPEMAAPWRSIISADRWKLNLSPIDQCELYDLNDDPYETTNLFDDLQRRDRIRDLASRIRSWQKQTDDVVKLPSFSTT